MTEVETVKTETTASQEVVSTSGTASQEAKPNGQDQTVATGDEPKGSDETAKPYWPEDWRQKIAEHAGAGNAKAVEKELRRLEGMTDPAALFSRWREMENTWASRNFVKKPGKDATPEDIAEFHRALGVPEKPEDYFKDLKFDNGLVLGEADRPIAESFATDLHKAGATPQQVQAALSWYLKHEEAQAAALDEADDAFRREAEQALKNELGAAFKRKTNNIATVFQTAAGGADIKNDNSVYARLMGGRTADGKLIGNDPDIVRWLIGLSQEINPAAAVVEDADISGRSIDSEISALEKRMKGVDEHGRHDPQIRRAYFKDEAAQARYRELVGARDKIRAKAR